LPFGHAGLSGKYNAGKYRSQKWYHNHGCLFSLGTFVVYIIFGVGVFSVLQETSIADVFRFVLAAILLILGLMQLEDARRLQSGGDSLFRVDWTKKYVLGVISSRKLTA
jgi:cytochrome c biogenesis protein CcdA